MCTGSLLKTGFNVAIIAIDEYAGINYDSKFDFRSLPESLRSLAQKKIGYYSCGNLDLDPKKLVRRYVGPKHLPFLKDTVSSENLSKCGTIFTKSVKHVDLIFAKIFDTKLDMMIDPDTLPDNSEIKKSFRKIYKNAFTMRTNSFGVGNLEIIDELKRVASNSRGDDNAVAFIDPFGNLVLCQSGNEKISPIRTALMEVIQNYSKTLWNLMNDENTRVIAEKTLAHPRFGTFLFLYAPEPDEPKTVMDLGAYSFTMYKNNPKKFSNLQYVNPPRKGEIKDLISLISNLPPFYSEQVNLTICQIPN
jgi:cytosine deaminase